MHVSGIRTHDLFIVRSAFSPLVSAGTAVKLSCGQSQKFFPDIFLGRPISGNLGRGDLSNEARNFLSELSRNRNDFENTGTFFVADFSGSLDRRSAEIWIPKKFGLGQNNLGFLQNSLGQFQPQFGQNQPFNNQFGQVGQNSQILGQNQLGQNQPGVGQSQFGQNQLGVSQFGVNQFGQNQLGSNQFNQNQLGLNQFGQNQLGSNQFGQNQLGSNQFGQNQLGSNQLGPNQIRPNQFGQNQSGQNQFFQDSLGVRQNRFANSTGFFAPGFEPSDEPAESIPHEVVRRGNVSLI